MVVICTSGAASVGLAVTDFMLGVHICLKLHQHQMLETHTRKSTATTTAIMMASQYSPSMQASKPPLVMPVMETLGSDGGGGGATLAIVGGVTTASTAIETLVTVANMAVALLVVLVAVAIVDCTEAAVAVGVRMRTLMMTLPGDMVNCTADVSTPALAAVALLI